MKAHRGPLTIYVSDTDFHVWKAAAVTAKAQGLSLSASVARVRPRALAIGWKVH